MIPWIKIETSLPRKPEVMQLAEILDIDHFAVVGHLVCFWSWVDENVSQECPVVIGTKKGLDRVAGRDGFTDAMIQVKWLEMDGNSVKIPHFEYHLSKGAKTRALEARKKSQQRAAGQKAEKCPDGIGTKSGREGGPDKSRVDEIETTKREAPKTQKPEHTGGLDEIVIPSKMDTSECRRASEMWFAYLDEKGLSDKRPNGAIALQCWWSQMARIGPKRFPEAVEASIAKGLWNVVAPQEATAKAAKTEGGDWLKVLDVCKQHSGATQQDTEARKAKLSERQYSAAKRVGIARIAAASSYDQKQLEQEFKHAIGGQS